MRTKIFQRDITLVSLTTLLFLGLSVSVLIGENKGAAFPAALSTIEKSIHGRNELTSNNDLMPAASAKDHPANTLPFMLACPPPTKQVANQCVLTRDVTLDQTLTLLSDTTLDCRGHKLSAKPTLPNPNSQPQVGILLNNVQNVLIQRCVIDGFDFGVFAINSKPMGTVKSFVMSDNIIKSRYTAVSLMSVNNAEVSGNDDISYTRTGGRALYIGRNSDFNEIVNNTFVANLVPGASNMSAFRVPGPASDAKGTNPKVTTPGAVIVIAQIEGREPTLLNAIIGRKLFQLTTTDNLEPNSDFTEGNRFQGNTIRFSRVRVDGVVLAVPQGTQVIGNKIVRSIFSPFSIVPNVGEAGIRVGIQSGGQKVFPGSCSKLPTRLCLEDKDCNIPQVDLIHHGTCTVRQPQAVKWISKNTLIAGNVITGLLGSGINTTGQRTTIQGNTIIGPFRTAPNTGIQLMGKHALEATTVSRNSVTKVAVALRLVRTIQDARAESFVAEISLNDFTVYKTAVLTSNTIFEPIDPTYNLRSKLTVKGLGNFWGTPCSVGLDPSKVKQIDGKIDNSVTDEHPYPMAIAKRPVLPSPCPQVVGP